MDSIKDLISEIRNNRKERDEIPQSELFDTSFLEDNPKRIMGDRHKYISKEYQLYGLRLSNRLDDKERATMYIRWAKEKPRSILEQALSFTVDYPNAESKSKIFMWKVKELEKQYSSVKKQKKERKKKRIIKKKLPLR